MFRFKTFSGRFKRRYGGRGETNNWICSANLLFKLHWVWASQGSSQPLCKTRPRQDMELYPPPEHPSQSSVCLPSKASPGSLPALNIPWIYASPVSILSPQRLHTAPSAPHPGCGAVLGVSPSQQLHQSEITAGFSETLALPSPRVQPNISVSHGVHCVTDKDKERILVPSISKLDM